MPLAMPSPTFEPIAPESAGMPLFRVVQRSLLGAIRSGTYPPGETLPSETSIAGAMGVSIGTLRRAVDELVAQHILVRRQGRGTFVARHAGEHNVFRFFALERGDGLREAPSVDILSFARGPVQGEAATALALRAGEPAIHIETRVSLQGAAVGHERLTLPAELFKGLTERQLRDRPGTMYQFYQAAFGVTVLRARERARAVAADRAAARVLGVAVGHPVLRLRRTAFTFGERAVEHRISIVDTTRHDYLNNLAPPADTP
jgi:GntR family transcriptional regulator